ncbi:MAG: glycosyltransferase family 4 protein [Actinomycetota bacterium]
MRIVQLTPGTGSFYCGTCLRDNAMVTEMRRQGHDAMLVPMYLPLTLDQAPASEGVPVFYGGVNVYLQQKLSLFRHTPRWLDKVLDAPGLLGMAAQRAGMTSGRELGEITLSMLRGEEGLQVKELDRLVKWLIELRPEVVCLSNLLLIGLARRIKSETGAAVVCTLQGEDSFLDSIPEPEGTLCWNTIAERAADVDRFIAVSRYYADVMRERARIPENRLDVVYAGVSLDGYEPAAAPPNPPVLGYLARMCEVKGLPTLVDAYILLRERNRIPGLKLRVAGSMTEADAKLVARLRERLTAKGIAGDAEFLPNLDRDAKISFLQSLSALSVPAVYGESFGLYVIEAMAAAVPVVQPRHGAFPELVAETGGGVLCEPGDAQALADAIEDLLMDPVKARALGARGRASVMERFTAPRLAEETVRVFEKALARSPERPAVGSGVG